MNFHKLKEIFSDMPHNDKIKDGSVFGSAGIYAVTYFQDFSVSKAIGIVTLTIGLLRLIEIFSGKTIAEILRRKK